MLGHRKLTVDDYIAILKRRRWLIAIPVLILPFVAYAITFFIPAQYVSQTLVLIEDQKVPEDIARSVMSTSLDSRLSSMREQILSRSRLQPIIERYNLYATRHISMDARIDLTRKAIAITPIRSAVARTGGLPGFFISFTAGDARTAQLVCGEITTLFVDENLKSREASAEGTTDFLKRQLDNAKRDLDDQDAKLAAFQRQYVGKLPGQENTSMNMLTSLNTQLEASTQALARMEQDKDYEQTMLSQMLQNSPAASAGTPTQTPQADQAELTSLLTQESDLLSHYTADYPDVIALRRKIAELRKKMAQPAPAATAASTSAAPNTAPNRSDTPAIQQLRAQLRSSDLGIQAKKQEQAHIQSNIALYQDRIAASPLVEEQYKDITRDYDTAQKFYDDLLNKMNHSQMATDLERTQQGEQFRVMDEPNLPESPTFPNRQLFAAGGLFAGLILGLMIAALLEYKDTALRTEQDVWAFTRLPTLAIIAYAPEVDLRRGRQSGWARFKSLFQEKAPVNNPIAKARP